MGKVKRLGRKHSNHHDNPQSTKSKVIRRQHSQIKPHSTKEKAAQAQKNGSQTPRLRVPFSKHDNLLLVGEGDFSFALSLKLHHGTQHITATCYDSKEVLQNKYPEVLNRIEQLESIANGTSRRAAQEEGLNADLDKHEVHESEWKGFSPSPRDSPNLQSENDRSTPLKGSSAAVLYGIDATKLSSAHKKALREQSPFTKIVFNFPHVGGLSTDVNRQVRYNQELLVGFFKAAKPLLSSPSRPARPPALMQEEVDEDEDNLEWHDAEDPERPDPLAVNGQILVTLFEGEPYSLWNIRDLARHCGLKVVESFRFPWSAYPGYQHARTIGEVRTGKDRADEGKRKGAWRGEEREARCYVLEDQNAELVIQSSSRKKKKKKQTGEDEDSD